MSELIASLRKMSINGNRLELPSEQLANYADVKKALQKAGGKYVKCGFVLPTAEKSPRPRDHHLDRD